MADQYSNELYHYGVKGQQWGVRRYMNEDGTLTPEGRERYSKKNYVGDNGSDKVEKFARRTVGSEGGHYAFAKWRERRHDKNLEKAKASGNQKKIEKYESKKKAQSQANEDMKRYREHTSTGKLIAQNVGLGMLGLSGNRYRHARARGSDIFTSVLESVGGGIGVGMRMYNDKKRYGKYVVYGDDSGESM